MNKYFVYISTNQFNTVLYTGVTNSLETRMHQHSNKLVDGFSSKYNICKLVYYEFFDDPVAAIAAEKKIKGWTRARKLGLIKKSNPDFKDLLS